MKDADSAKTDWYSNTQARINTVVGGSFTSEHWNAIKQSRQDWLVYVQETESISGTYGTLVSGFPMWLRDKYGISLIHVDHGLDTKFDVVAESNYVMFLLKYK